MPHENPVMTFTDRVVPRARGRRSLVAAAAWLQGYVILGGLVSLWAWIADRPRLGDWDNNGITIQPNTTVAAIAAGLGVLLLLRGLRRAAAALGALVALIGATALFQHVSGVDLGIDTLLMFGRTWGRQGVLSPGRMGPPAATSWTLLGLAIVLAARPSGAPTRRIAPMLGVITASLSGLALIGYLYGVSSLYAIPTLTIIALQAASFILAASLGLLLAVPEHGLVRVLAEDSPGGVLARRAVPAILSVPVLVGLLRVVGERAALYDSAFGSAVRTLLEVLLLLALVWWTASAVDRHARQRAEVAAELAASRRQLEEELADTRLLQRLSSELIAEDESAPTLYERVVDAAVRIMRSDFASLQVLEAGRPVGAELRLLAFRGFDTRGASFWEWVRADSESVCGAALRERRRIVVTAVEECAWLAGTEHLRVYREQRVRAVQSTPLVSRSGVLVGVLSTHWTGRYEPTERQLRLLDILVRQAADLLERRQAEDLRRALLEKERAARADAERAGRLKDEFLATLSHELRTPLNAVIGWSQILKLDVLDSARVRAAAEVIERNGRVQAQLISDLLDVSRIISGNMRLDLRPIALPEVMASALESIMPAAEAKGVRLQNVMQPVAEPIIADPARLQQVIWNLLSNAVKFTPRGGTVVVNLAKVASHLEFRVTDTGEGIPTEFLPHIFERFRQADASASRAHSGLGLGLAIVKQLVELHGGTVRAASEGPGRGATFVIELPLAGHRELEAVRALAPGDAARAQAEAGRPADVRLDGLRVLVVDDEPDALAMVRRLLEAGGAAVSAAASSETALDTLMRETFDVIVSDIGLPRRDGYELIMAVRARGIRTPALALTAFAREDDRRTAFRSGYQAHSAKPLEPGALLATVASLAGRGRPSGNADVPREPEPVA